MHALSLAATLLLCMSPLFGARAAERAQPFPLAAVSLSGEFEAALSANLAYVLTLNDTQLACDYTAAANLTSCVASEGGWTTLVKQPNRTYEKESGFLPEGDDAMPPVTAPQDLCTTYCSANPKCAALCYRTPLSSDADVPLHASPRRLRSLLQTNVTCYFKTTAEHFVPVPPNGNCPSPGAPVTEKPVCNPLPGEMSLGGYYGHYQGHFLSATAMLINTTQNSDVQKKANVLIDALAASQAAWAKRYPTEDGYLFPYDIVAWRYLNRTLPYPRMPVYSVPFYTVHKLLAGLLDQHNLAHHPKALDMAMRLASWCYRYALNAIASGGETLWQDILGTEWGGMNEVLFNMYVATGDGEAWLLHAARLFDHYSWSQPLAAGIDDLAYQHANTHIPEVIGNAAGYEVTGNETDRAIARFFLDVLRANHSFATGGSNAAEHWGPADAVADQLLTQGGATEESCTQYNVLKLARRMWQWDPMGDGQVSLMDYYEVAFLNGIFGNQDRTWTSPSTGKPMTRFIYMLPQGGSNLKKAWGASDYGFVCCWASLTESFSKLGDTLYFHRMGEDGIPELFWNPYASASVIWPSPGKQFSAAAVEPYPAPSGPTARATLTLPEDAPSQRLRIHVRVPAWTGEGSMHNRLIVNDVEQPTPAPGFATIDRSWSNGDTVELFLAAQFSSVNVQDARDDVRANYRAYRFGPIVLARIQPGDDKLDPAGDPEQPNSWMQVSSRPGDPLRVRAKQANGKPEAVFIALRDVIDESYAVYVWTNFTGKE